MEGCICNNVINHKRASPFKSSTEEKNQDTQHDTESLVAISSKSRNKNPGSDADDVPGTPESLSESQTPAAIPEDEVSLEGDIGDNLISQKRASPLEFSIKKKNMAKQVRSPSFLKEMSHRPLLELQWVWISYN